MGAVCDLLCGVVWCACFMCCLCVCMCVCWRCVLFAMYSVLLDWLLVCACILCECVFRCVVLYTSMCCLCSIVCCCMVCACCVLLKFKSWLCVLVSPLFKRLCVRCVCGLRRDVFLRVRSWLVRLCVIVFVWYIQNCV